MKPSAVAPLLFGALVALAPSVFAFSQASASGPGEGGARPAAPTKAAEPRPLSFEGMDRNADARLSEEEVRNAMAFVFAGQDANRDGVVTRAEVERSGPGAVKTFTAIDAGKTGRIDLETFLDLGLSVFRAADTDGDGYVTLAERDALRAKVRAQHAADKR